ncbi:MAG TPA: Uma2 family endonuclease [Pirellulaceae bacterium]|nr:Uma2 family endonuclease [Pirellulaceae bacterium]
MSTNQPAIELEYPESDGRPMGETDLHRNWMIRIIDLLQQRYRGQRVYVTGDLLLYYQEGEPSRYLVPDVFVVFDSEPGLRGTYKLWEEGYKSPNVVIEVTSRWTRGEDVNHKPKKYAAIGVGEYFLYDPTCDYLVPPLRGFRLTDGEYAPIEEHMKRGFVSEQLNVRLCLEASRLVMYDLDSEERLTTEVEAAIVACERERAAREGEQAARKREQAARKREQAARKREQAAREAAESEVQRLRKLLDERENS